MWLVLSQIQELVVEFGCNMRGWGQCWGSPLQWAQLFGFCRRQR